MNEQRVRRMVNNALDQLQLVTIALSEWQAYMEDIAREMNTTGVRTCEQCGDGIGDHRRTCRFCSDRCRKRWHRAREKAALQPALPVEADNGRG